MAVAGAQTPSANQPATAGDSPAWLHWLEEQIKEEKGDYFGEPTFLEIVRDLLLAADKDDSAITKAVDRFKKGYVAGFTGKDAEKRKAPEYDAGLYVHEISYAVFGAASEIPFTDPKHDMLATFLITLRNSAATEFDLKNPQFVYYGWGLEEVASEKWNAFQVDNSTRDGEISTARQMADRWLSIAALLAKLFKGGLLDADGPRWIVEDLSDAFDNCTGDVTNNIGRQAQVLASANHILIAGEELVEEVKAPSKKWWFQLNTEKWKLWASKLQNLTDAVDDGAPWEFKARAQKAHNKMVELYPEAFTDDQNSSSQAYK